ncbi:hypothetical protein DRQ50_03420, partial [bacterium]
MTPSFSVPSPDGNVHDLPGELPLLPLRDVVVFPSMVTPLLVGRPASVGAVEAAMDQDKYLCVIAQREPETEDPAADDLFTVGTVIKVLQIIRTPDETLKVLVEGVARVHVADISGTGGYLIASLELLVEKPLSSSGGAGTEVEALSRSIKERFKEY